MYVFEKYIHPTPCETFVYRRGPAGPDHRGGHRHPGRDWLRPREPRPDRQACPDQPQPYPYHFRDKDALIFQALLDIASGWEGHVAAQVAAATTPPEQLRSYITATLAYMGTRPRHYAALIEIVFNTRTEDGILLYRLDEEDASLELLKTVLRSGQQAGSFRPFNVPHMALTVRGAINAFRTAMHKPGADLEAYTAHLVDLFLSAIGQP